MKTALRQPLRSALKNGLIPGVSLDSAIVNFDSRGIVGSTPVTAWTNNGTGGSVFDLDVKLGTPSNTTRITINGHDSVNSSGGAGLETTAGQTINAPMTIFMISKANALTGSQQHMTSARSDAGSSPFIAVTSTDIFRFNAGANLDQASGDTNLHLHTVRHNADGTSSYEVSGLAKITGNAGTEDMDFGAIFINHVSFNSLNGAISQYIIFDRALSDAEVLSVQATLTQKYGL